MTKGREPDTRPIGPKEARVPPLRAGDRLTRVEFDRRYDAMPEIKQAELIEGVVHLDSWTGSVEHAEACFDLIAWLGPYRAHTPAAQGAASAHVRLDWDNEPQPDACLSILSDCGGQARIVDGYMVGSPELIAEISASSASYDLHDKLNAYRRNGVREYVVWRVWDEAIDWFVLREGRYDRLELTPEGLYKSEVFPGSWLDPAALIAGEMPRVLAVLQQGLATPEHAAFLEKLRQAGNEQARG